MQGSDRRLRSWLHVADHPSWLHKPYYSNSLARALASAYDQLHHASRRPDPYFTAYALLAPFRGRLACAEQRLNLEFALALAFAGDGSVPHAIASLHSAWEIAESLLDWGAQAEIGYLVGALWLMQCQLPDAFAMYRQALDMLQRLERDDGPADPGFELDLVLRLAWCAFDLGWFPVCLRYLDEAYSLRATWVPDAAEGVANLVWLDSQLARIQGQPSRALNQAVAAADLLLTHGRPINRARAQISVAESALDLFELMRPSATNRALDKPPERTINTIRLSPAGLLLQARDAARLALEVTREVGDPVGATMARLVLRRAARLSRPRRGEESGVPAVEGLLRTANRLDDTFLLGRVEVALGDELLDVGSSEAARVTYERARRRFEEHYLGGLAFWPRLALQHLADESS
jgi:tetratricopeptide (TPR) repeat protein